jgi:hypothetical protein
MVYPQTAPKHRELPARGEDAASGAERTGFPLLQSLLKRLRAISIEDVKGVGESGTVVDEAQAPLASQSVVKLSD